MDPLETIVIRIRTTIVEFANIVDPDEVVIVCPQVTELSVKILLRRKN